MHIYTGDNLPLVVIRHSIRYDTILASSYLLTMLLFNLSREWDVSFNQGWNGMNGIRSIWRKERNGFGRDKKVLRRFFWTICSFAHLLRRVEIDDDDDGDRRYWSNVIL